MKLAKVIGTVVATTKIENIEQMKLMMVQPLVPGPSKGGGKLENGGTPIVAVDTVGAGPGELVYLTLSREACLALPNPFNPVDAAITGIVDHVNLEGTGIVHKEQIFREAKS
ncbi:MAG: EutN/CcmL family microcompartment protein [bacterium]|nr:EutN/CcmL family microcompartment protein [bacterium]